MLFKHTSDLPSSPTKHLFHLHLEGLGDFEKERGYCVLIYLELIRRLNELKIDQFRWVKPDIMKEANKFYNGSFDDSEED